MSRKGSRCVVSLTLNIEHVFTYYPQLAMWHETGHRSEVTCIVQSPQPDIFAVGYSDGSIRLWNASSSSVIATFNGHKKAVTVLTFDHTGTRLASGSQDTNLIVWDVVGEAGLFRYFACPSSFLPVSEAMTVDFVATATKLPPSSSFKSEAIFPQPPPLPAQHHSYSPPQKTPS